MTDLFDEVDERIRSDRFRAFALKAAPWALGLLVVVLAAIGAYYGWREHRENQAAKASEQYEAALGTLMKGQKAAAFQQFGAVAKSGPAGYKALALMQQAALRLADGKQAEAVALYDAAAKAAPGRMIEDAARLKAALTLVDTAPLKDLETRLTPLTAEDRPYRPEAMEALAFAKLAAGDLKGARETFVVIALMPGVSETARGRADAAKTLIDSGAAKEVPAIIKSAAALPPGQASPTVSAAGATPAPPQAIPGSQ